MNDQPAPQSSIGLAREWIGSIRATPPDEDAVAALDDLLPEGPELRPYLRRFSILIVLSSSIAAFGLLADSGAVVIGAMLVAPLMTPIMGAAAATVRAQNGRLMLALAIIALGTALAFVFGWLVALIAADRVVDVRELPDEIRSRTFPGLLDLGIAITAGAAAGFIQPRRSTISALPGVGIAVALVPPLATAGITFHLGLGGDSWNAFLLYVTNLAAIVFSAGLVLVLSGFRPHGEPGVRAIRVRLAGTLAAVALVAIPLTLHTQSVIRDQQLRSAVRAAIEAWDDEVRILDQRSDAVGDRAEVQLLLVGRGDPPPVYQLAEDITARFGRPIDLRVRYQTDQLFVVSTR